MMEVLFPKVSHTDSEAQPPHLIFINFLLTLVSGDCVASHTTCMMKCLSVWKITHLLTSYKDILEHVKINIFSKNLKFVLLYTCVSHLFVEIGLGKL